MKKSEIEVSRAQSRFLKVRPSRRCVTQGRMRKLLELNKITNIGVANDEYSPETRLNMYLVTGMRLESMMQVEIAG